MDKPMSNVNFKVMSFLFKIRDLLSPREKVLLEVGIEPGHHVLDYGCGPGSYIPSLSKLVGKTGKIYALDIHPLAISRVENLAKKMRLENVNTILSDCATGLVNESQDAVLLYDIFHGLSDEEAVLSELYRVLKPDGILSFSDHHMSEDMILSKLPEDNMFKLIKKGKKTYNFKKNPKS